MAKRKREPIQDLEPNVGLDKKECRESFSLNTFATIQDLLDHLGSGTRVEFIHFEEDRVFPIDQSGFPECTKDQVSIKSLRIVSMLSGTLSC